ncbi:MAG: MBL fold metallo-hydrolase [Chloroflexi bacterium]|nr:MBL fold metallo-hydrolase [Chloroflexota bacterium]
MELTWYGLATFRISDRRLKVVTDPYGPEVGLSLPRLRADVVTVSHDRPGHNYVKAVKGYRKLLDGPGEYEVGGVFITGIRTWHRAGKNGEPNTIFLFEFGDITVCHLGDLGYVPKQEEIEQLGEVSILLVPIGGHETLNGAEAAEVVSLIEPAFVIPMHYALPGLVFDLDPLDKFLREMGVSEPRELPTLKVNRKSELSEETEVILLQPRHEGA